MAHAIVKVLTPHLVAGRQVVAGAVYGTVSVVAVIAGASHEESSAGRVFAFAAVSSVVIWAIHIYAATLGHAGPNEMRWGVAIRLGLRHEVGVLEGAFIPLLVLLLGVVGVVKDSYAIAGSMWAGVALLVLLPSVWLRRAGNSWWKCLLASAFGGFLGLLLVGMTIVLH